MVGRLFYPHAFPSAGQCKSMFVGLGECAKKPACSATLNCYPGGNGFMSYKPLAASARVSRHAARACSIICIALVEV